MGLRGPKSKLGRGKRATDYKRIDFQPGTSPEQIEVLAKLKGMKPEERTAYVTALYVEDQQRHHQKTAE